MTTVLSLPITHPRADASPSPIHAIIGDGRSLLRSALVRVLASLPDIAVVADVSSAVEALECVHRLRPHLVLVHAELIGGLHPFVEALPARLAGVRVLIYGVTARNEDVVAAIRAGASALSDDGMNLDLLASAVRTVAMGGTVVPTASMWFATERAVPVAVVARPGVEPVTRRELEVLRMIAVGRANKEISDVLGLSEHTVRAHLRNISRKLGARNRLQAVSLAIRSGLLTNGNASDLSSNR